MYVACSTLCFARYPLERALRIIGELEFSKLDVAIHERGPHLKPSQVAADVAQAAQLIRIGPSLTPAAFDIEIDAAGESETTRAVEGPLQAGTHVHRFGPHHRGGVVHGVGVDAEVARLKKLVHFVDAEGLVLTVATRIGTLTEQPADRSGIMSSACPALA